MKSQLCKQVQISKSWRLGKDAVLIFKSQFAVKCFVFVAENLIKDWLLENFPQTWIIELSLFAKHFHPLFSLLQL